jgi:GNAT superfamily N-acetyltransferase
VHHDPDEILDAFSVDPFRVEVSTAGPDTVIDYFDDDADELRQVASIRIRLHRDEAGDGVEAVGFWVHPDYQNRGIFTNAHRWAVEQPFSLISADTAEAEFYKQSGYVEREDGMLVLDRRATGKWLKGR